jgi:5-formyltetrahydrofolate cyclo-ligase
MTAEDPIRAAKAALRQAAFETRARIASAGTAERLRDLGLATLGGKFGAVSAYWPIRTEIDPRPLLIALAGSAMALPVVIGPGHPLEFRRWREGDTLDIGVFGTAHPPATAEIVEPDLLLVPLLAFDRRRYRLGYGAGYYDRTLAGLRSRKKIMAVGVAFAGQEVDSVPIDGWDQQLDLVITDRDII